MIRAADFLADQRVMRHPEAPVSPLVSVILPTFRRAKNGFLQRAIRSVLAQSLPDFELLVMDDGSTDGSNEIIEGFRAADPRIVHVRHERNCGLPGLRVNEGIELARGRFLAFQFDDDSWRPRALEALAGEAERHRESVVVVGRCHARGRTQELMMPFLEVTLTNLMQTNFIGNNSVLVPRRVADELGMYDCHIAMRRLCDWDLWQRLAHHVPFVPIQDVVADVYAEQQDSVGMTMPYDLSLVRLLQAIDRNAHLTPARWRDYEIDALTIAGVPIAGEYRRRLYEEHIVPYYLKFRHIVPDTEGFPTNLPTPRRSVVYARPSYDALNEMAFNHYDSLTTRRETYKACFQYSAQMEHSWVREADAALLVRPYQESERAVMEQAIASGRPAGVYLDDDFLTLHEYGPPFDFVAPGTAHHRNLVEMLERADAVWVTSPAIAESVRACTGRIVPHALAIPEELLPGELHARSAASPLRIGYVGTGYRLEEFRILWDALVRLSAEHGPRVEFEFWGLDVSSLPALSSPVRQVAYETSYFRFLDRLRSARFDLLLSPLLDRPRARLAKNAHKYFHVAVAGALGIFSRVPPYARLPEGLTCLKAENTPADWHRVLREAVAMPPAQFDLMRRRALEHVREEFTAAAQIDLHEAAWRATEWHARTRAVRGEDGRPRVVSVVGEIDGDADVRLERWLLLQRQYGVEPVMILGRPLAATVAGQRFAEALAADDITCHVASLGEGEVPSPNGPSPPREELAALLERVNPALVHSFGYLPLIGQTCSEKRLAHVASLDALEDDVVWPAAPSPTPHCAVNHSDSLRCASQWRERLGSESFCSREAASPEAFDLGLARHLESLGAEAATPSDPVRIVVAGPLRAAGGQLEAIAAVVELRAAGAWMDWRLAIEGALDVDPEYVQRCRARIESANLGDRVRINSAPGDVVRLVASADIVLSPTRSASIPLSVKEAMAGGALVVATPVGGVPEVVIDGVSGILCADASAEAIAEGVRRAVAMPAADRRRMVEQARRVAHTEFRWQRGANDVFSLYNRALEITQGAPAFVPRAPWRPDSTASAGQGERVEAPAQPAVSHVRLHGHLTYHFVPRARGWCGLDVLVGTHQQSAHGSLELTVLSPTGHVVRAARANLTTVRDNDWVRFEFAPIANAVDLPFALRFELADPGHRSKLSLYDVAAGGTSFFQRALRRLHMAPARNSLYCRSRYVQ